jgi:hypothetical protein
MKNLRVVFVWLVGILLGVGYASSQLAYFAGQAEIVSYTHSIDVPAVKYLALGVFLVMVIFGATKDPKEPAERVET